MELIERLKSFFALQLPFRWVTGGSFLALALTACTNSSNPMGSSAVSPAPVVVDAPRPVSITSPSSPHVTNANSVVVEGNCLANHSIQVWRESIPAYSVCSSAGTFSITLTSSELGTFSYLIHQANQQKLVSAGTPFVWTRLAGSYGAPQVTNLTSPYTGQTPTLTLAGTCVPGNMVNLNGFTSLTATCTPEGTFSFSNITAFNDGTYVLTLTQSDTLGTSSPATQFSWTREAVPPNPPVLTSPVTSPFYSSGSSIVIAGSCDSNVNSTVYLSGASTQSVLCSNNTFSFTFESASDGTFQFNLKQVSGSGASSSSVSTSWTRMTTPPSAPVVTSPTSPHFSTGSSISLSGTCFTGSTVSVSGAANATTPCNSGGFSVDIPIVSDGLYTFNLKQTDMAGNSSNSSSFVWQKGAGSIDSIAFTQAPPVISSADNLSVVKVTEYDANGNQITGDSVSLIALSAFASANCSGSPVAGALSLSSSVVSGGVATFSGFGIHKTSIRSVLASSANGKTACADNLVVNPGVLSSLAFTSGIPNPTTADVAGTIAVTAYDAKGNVLTNDSSSTLALAAYSSSNCSGPTLSGALSSNSSIASSGMGSFPNFRVLRTEVRSVGVTTGGKIACAPNLTVNHGAPSALLLTGVPDTATAGVSIAFAVTAKDAAGNVATNYPGIVSFSSSDGVAILPSSSGLVSGTKTFNITLKTTGTQTITITDSTLSATSGSIAVGAGPASTLALSSVPLSAEAGNGFNVTVTAKDAMGNVATGYAGTVNLVSSDGAAVFSPASSTLNGGTSSFNVILKTAGENTLTASDGTRSVTSSNITVNPGAFDLSKSVVTLSSPTVVSGSLQTATLTTKDSYGNLNPAGLPFTSSIAFTSSLIGGSVTFSPVTSQGSGVFAANFTGGAVGAVSIGATISGNVVLSSKTLSVLPGVASSLEIVSAPSAATSDVPFTITVNARDSNGNIVSTYPNAVSLVSTDGAAILPGASGLSSGSKTFSVTLRTAGPRYLTVSDGTLSTTTEVITVNPNSASALELSGVPSTRTAGSSFSVTVTAKDAAGNTAVNYPQAVSFTSSDETAVLPSATQLTNGVGTFLITLKKAGAITLGAGDGVLSTGSSTLSVGPGSYDLSQSMVTAATANVNAGSSTTITLTTKDAFGNSNPSGLPGLGLIGFTSSTIGGTGVFGALTAAGSGVFTASFTGGINGLVNIGAVINSSPVSNATFVTVNPGSVSQLSFTSVPVSISSGAPFTVMVTAKDPSGNTVTSYSGTVAIASNDPAAILPAAANLSNGVGGFTVRLNSVGSRTLTASDGVRSVTTPGITVSAGEAASLTYTTIPSSAVAGNSFTVVVSARDSGGNIATGYSGFVTITSDDAAAVLPTGSTLSNGTKNFVVTLKTAGARTVIASDGTLSVSSAGIAVSPGAYDLNQSGVTVASSGVVSGSSVQATLTLKDAYGNANPSGVPAVASMAFNSSSVGGTGTFGAISNAGSGVYHASFTGVIAGSVTISATVAGSAIANNASIAVTPGAASSLVLGSVPSATVAGNSFALTVTARDAAGNTATGYGGTVAWTSSDTAAVLPAGSTLSNGVRTFNATLKTTGSRTLTAGDGVFSVTSSGISVTPAGYDPTQSIVTAASSSVASGATVLTTLTTKDAFGNLNPTGLPALGSIGFTSSTVGGTGSFGAVTNLGSGVYTATFSGGAVGSVALGATISGTVVSNPATVMVVASAPSLSYAGASGTSGSVGVAMTVSPTTLNNNGAAITACGIKSGTTALPAWASVNATTCVISGTPSGTLSSTTYTLVATNAVGASSNATVSLSVSGSVPNLSYAGATGTSGSVGVAMTVSPTTLNNNGPAISACGIKSGTTALPAWASVNATTCVISGTPDEILGSTLFTLVAVNAVGNSADATVTLLVAPSVPTLSYFGSAGTTGSVGSVMSVSPTVIEPNGAAITACGIKSGTTALPAWASVNALTCTISGTPTASLSATTYTLVATNSAGVSLDATVSLTVNALPSLVVSPVFSVVHPNLVSSVSFSSPQNPTAYSVSSGFGSISSSTGFYSVDSGVKRGSTQISASANGQIGTATVVQIASRFNGAVSAIAISNGFGYFGGSFTSYNPRLINGIMKINANSGDLESGCNLAGLFNPGAIVRAMVETSSHLFIGGSFSSFAGVSVQNLVKVDKSSCALDTAFSQSTGTNSTVNALAVAGSSLYVGGSFTTYRGVTAQYLAKVDLNTGGLDTTFTQSTGTSSSVSALAIAGSSLYVGGNFATYRGITASRLAKVDLNTGALDTTFTQSTGANSTVNALAVAGSSLYLGGGFSTYRGVAAQRLAKVDLNTGGLDTTFTQSTGASTTVNALAVAGSSLYVGGGFTTYRGVAASRLAIVDLTTGNLDSVFSGGMGANNTIFVLAVSGSSVFAGGSLVAYRGTPAQFLAKVNLSTGELDTTFTQTTGLDSGVSALAIAGSSLYVGGGFTTYRGVAAQRLAKVDLITGALDTTFTQSTGPDSSVSALAVAGSSLYVGGSFSTYRGVAAQRLAKVDLTTGALDTTFTQSTGANSTVSALAVVGSSLYLGGSFTTYRGSGFLNISPYATVLGLTSGDDIGF